MLRYRTFYTQKRFCRWCGIRYKPDGYTVKDGFCCDAHRQAHYRAYKRYVTAIHLVKSTSRNAKKKRSKKKI